MVFSLVRAGTLSGARRSTPYLRRGGEVRGVLPSRLGVWHQVRSAPLPHDDAGQLMQAGAPKLKR